ncbi:putative protein S-acyltransferase 7 [Lathyrus oleraceus]|uniref:Uncharacterized protein n=1 Tax=Pisum sativum TaxID=3888 RepID=A0A9D4XV86_PEA|nr:putative protein S-acyltransferase 7 [Pisum sativum]
MYVVPPPQRSDPGSGSDGLRVYQAWKGSNKFFLQGRFIFGPDVRSLALTIFLIVAPVAVFCVFVARKLLNDFSDHWGISIMAVAVVFTVYVRLVVRVLRGYTNSRFTKATSWPHALHRSAAVTTSNTSDTNVVTVVIQSSAERA